MSKQHDEAASDAALETVTDRLLADFLTLKVRMSLDGLSRYAAIPILKAIQSAPMVSPPIPPT